ncbi:MAG TPA: hypothetical protein VHE81_06470 [Lacipirellulaceae bacterium]|nr:hypothetical protein [Lacipirellulaceae bacterium]
MKSDEIIEAVEGVETAVIDDAKKARGWLKSAWDWAWNTSWKTKAVVGVILLTGLLCGMASAYRSPTYLTRSEASVMLSARETATRASLDSMSRRMDVMEAGQHQLDSRLKAIEAKPEPAPITTGSIPKKKVSVKKHARKPASSWFDLP